VVSVSSVARQVIEGGRWKSRCVAVSICWAPALACQHVPVRVGSWSDAIQEGCDISGKMILGIPMC